MVLGNTILHADVAEHWPLTILNASHKFILQWQLVKLDAHLVRPQLYCKCKNDFFNSLLEVVTDQYMPFDLF